MDGIGRITRSKKKKFFPVFPKQTYPHVKKV